MNTFLILIIGIPIVEIALMIKVGQNIGAANTILLILLTAITGIFLARREGLKTIQTGLFNIYKNRPPVYELISGASIAIATFLLIMPGFISDAFGFLILIPITRKIIINFFLKKNTFPRNDKDVLDGEIVDDDKNDKL